MVDWRDSGGWEGQWGMGGAIGDGRGSGQYKENSPAHPQDQD